MCESQRTVAVIAERPALDIVSSASSEVAEPLTRRLEGKAVTLEEARKIVNCHRRDLPAVLEVAAFLRTRTYRQFVTYSRKVFIPLTNMCRDTCSYCGFRKDPTDPEATLLTPSEVLDLARKGESAGCKEALFMLGDRPEARYETARSRLRHLGYRSIVDYLVDMTALVTDKTSLLPHSNAGLLTKREMESLRKFNVSLGLMLENVSEKLCERGGPHEFALSKRPKARLATIENAGQLQIPFTTGLLIGIGESPTERVDSLFAIAALHELYGHIQEVIIQNFSPKLGTCRAGFPSPTLEDMLRTIALARIILPDTVSIQAPPNLTPYAYHYLLSAGINDWGGISPVTVDFVNPEAPWPEIRSLRTVTARCGFELRERLPLYPSFVPNLRSYCSPQLAERIRAYVDSDGFVRRELTHDS